MDIYAILEKLENMGFLKMHKQVGNYMQIYCPFHKEGHEKRPSCGVLLHDEFRAGKKYPRGWFHCFTCGFSHTLPDAVTELLKIKHIDKSGIEWLSENIPEFDFEENNEYEKLLSDDVIDFLEDKYAISYIQSATKNNKSYVSEEELKSYRYTIPYMYERRLTDEIIEKFDVGFDANWIPSGKKVPVPCITFPVRDSTGKTLFICRRSVKGKLFNYPQGVTKPVYGLYELPKDCKSVIICESCFNALTCWVYGKPAVALLGTGNSYQLQQLKELGVNEFIFALDPDEAGHKATEKLSKALKNVAITWTLSGIPQGKDINDLTKEEFENLDFV